MSMNNFLNFIDKDIAIKKTQIQTLPIKTKTNIKKFNETIETFETKYDEYRSSVRNYLLAKSRSFELTDSENEIRKNEINNKVITLERIKFLLNPLNTYVEKMGFDILLYQLSNYHVFNFNSLNEIINNFLDKFELVGIKLTKNDFDYTCYVYEYMSSFLEIRYSNDKNYDKLSEIFEKIYWLNPDIIGHIELNFRKLIRINPKKFENYIEKIQEKVIQDNNISSYQVCLEKLKAVHLELKNVSKETIGDIIKKSKNNEFKIEHYQEDNKVRINTYNSLIPNTIDVKDVNQMMSIYQNLEKLKDNILEYQSYLDFLPLLNSFKEKYEKLLQNESKDYKELSKITETIIQKEKELDKINRKIIGKKNSLFDVKNENTLKKIKMESIAKAKELYELYKEKDEKYFNSKVLSILNRNATISDILHLYYSFDYFKKLEIQNSYEINLYDEIMQYSNNFDLYAMDSTNVVISSIPVFEESNIPKIIANKYKLCNINITENDLQEENLKNLLNKINLILRIKKIEDSALSVEKILFVTWVEKMVAMESSNV